jgi:hypothetical protein
MNLRAASGSFRWWKQGLGWIAVATRGDRLDIDLYVYTTAAILLAARETLVAEMQSSRADLNLQLWDLGDEWYDAQTGIEVDVIYWNRLDRRPAEGLAALSGGF